VAEISPRRFAVTPDEPTPHCASDPEDSLMLRSHPGPGRARANTPLLNLEPLEERNLLSASSSLLVTFNSGAGVAIGEQVVPGTTIEQAVSSTPGLYVVNVDSGVNPDAALAAFQANPAVANAQLNSTLSVASLPPISSYQYGLSNTGQYGGTAGADAGVAGAWPITTGSYGVVVAVMDTGIDYDQADLYDNIWLNNAEIPRIPFTTAFDQAHGLPLGSSRYSILQDVYHDGSITFADLNNPINQGPGKITKLDGKSYIDATDVLDPMVTTTAAQPGQSAKLYDTGAGGWAYTGNTQDGDTAHPNDFVGWNFVNNTNNPLDDNGHGTNVAGIIGAQDTSGNVAGVDLQVSLMDVKFIASDGTGSLSDFIAGLQYAIKHGAKISNNSWSGAANTTDLYNVIAAAQQSGMIFVAAAGNYASNTDVTPYYPGSYTLPNIVNVAALDDNAHLASFSDYGATSVDLGAPGVNILSTLPNNQYGAESGTSQAAPFVAGVMALVWSKYPTLTYQQVISDIYQSVTPVAALKGKSVTGGEVNAAAALKLAADTLAPPVALNAVSLSGTSSITTIQVTFSQVMDPPSFYLNVATLTTPAGLVLNPKSITAVVGSGNKVFNFVFATQVADGVYSFALNTQSRNAKGTRLVGGYQQNILITNPEVFTSNTALTLPPEATEVSSLQVTNSFAITNVTVTLNLTQTHDGNLFIYLQSPTGVKVYLTNDVGGTGNNFTNTVFSDSGVTSITNGQAPFTGTFQPETPLAALVGLQAQGTWKLVIEDTIPGYSGKLLNWTLTFNTNGTVISTQSSTNAAQVSSSTNRGSISSVGSPILVGSGTGADSSAVEAALLLGTPSVAEGSPTTPKSVPAPTLPSPLNPLDMVFGSAQGINALVAPDVGLLVAGCSDTPSAYAPEDEVFFV
jgi:serine protease